MPKLGIDPMKVEQQVELYDILVRLAPHERYALMTLHFEAGSFGAKATVMDRVRELNDFESDTLLAFDRNDEQNHVRYGHRWLETMMELFGEEGPPEAFMERTRKKFEQVRSEVSPGIPHSLSPAERITAAKILAMVEADA